MAQTYNNNKLESIYGHDTIRAFAKICGRDWTYYVQDNVITFGREQAQENDDDVQDVHIDLGPSKVVSRTHAVVTYDHDAWYMKVHGRNGVKLDNEDLQRGEEKPIHCGTVIAIAGTEMLFQVADTTCNIAQRYKDRALNFDENVENEALRAGFGNAHPPMPSYYPPPGLPYSGGAPFPNYPPLGTAYGEQPNVASASSTMFRPVTPNTSPSKKGAPGSTKKRSPGNRRQLNGLMMESTEQIDYAHDSSKGIKPACSYASMITWAILSAEEETLSLAGIYEWIKKNYAFYRHTLTGWQVWRPSSTSFTILSN